MKSKRKFEKKRQNQANHQSELPRNILPVGEPADEDIRIYIHSSVYKKILDFSTREKTNESGGFLIGNVINEFGKTNVIIKGFVEARHAEATPTTLKFTHQTWEYCHRTIDQKYSSQKILGWIHTHPDFGIFLSEYDKFIHKNFFVEKFQIAFVIDPIQQSEGFYFWKGNDIVKIDSFYLFDHEGKKISPPGISKAMNNPNADGSDSGLRFLNDFAFYAMLATNVLLIIMLFYLAYRTNLIERKYNNLVSNFNFLSGEVQNLKDIAEAG